MAHQDVYMKPPEVRKLAKKFGEISSLMKKVSKILGHLVNVLKATAFIGFVGGAAVIQFIERVKPRIDQVAQKCAELSKDLTASVDAYERGDALGATRFY